MKLLALFLFISTAFAADLKIISPQEAKMLLTKNRAVIIDVREPNETAAGIITGAKVLPMSLMKSQFSEFKKEIEKLPKNKTIIVYCAAGRRAQLVGHEIENLGYKVLSLGAYSNWVEAGYSTSK